MLRPGLLVEDRRAWLYLIVESDTGWVRYVGRTRDPVTRIKAHRKAYPLRILQTELVARGAQIEMILLRQLDAEEDGDAAEQAEMNKRAHLEGLFNQKSASGYHAEGTRFRRHLSKRAAKCADRNG